MSIERHVLMRTSPKGDSFFGTCAKCGKKNVSTHDQMRQVCPNPDNKTQAITGD